MIKIWIIVAKIRDVDATINKGFKKNWIKVCNLSKFDYKYQVNLLVG